MNFFKKIFKRKREPQQRPEPRPLRIRGCKTELTPAPDDAELSAQALLETMMGNGANGANESPVANRAHEPHDATYYKQLAERIRKAQQQEVWMTMRFLAYCEAQLKMSDGRGKVEDVNTPDFAELERGLYQHQDTAEREGGDFLRRWQHCLAECVVRGMKSDV